jgi:predicted SAM-dependent methyltransferase
LEHFPWAQGCKVLTEWARLVAPGGLLKIEVPDFLAACQEILSIDSEAGDFALQQIVFGAGHEETRFLRVVLGRTNSTAVRLRQQG